jgi:hypothetical protein
VIESAWWVEKFGEWTVLGGEWGDVTTTEYFGSDKWPCMDDITLVTSGCAKEA